MAREKGKGGRVKPRKKAGSSDGSPQSSSGTSRHTSTEPEMPLSSSPPIDVSSTQPRALVDPFMAAIDQSNLGVKSGADAPSQIPGAQSASKPMSGTGPGVSGRVVLDDDQKKVNHRRSEDARRRRVNSKYKELAEIYMPEFHGNPNSEKEIIAGILKVAWETKHKNDVLRQRYEQNFGKESLDNLLNSITPRKRRPSVSESEGDSREVQPADEDEENEEQKLETIKAMLALSQDYQSGPMLHR